MHLRPGFTKDVAAFAKNAPPLVSDPGFWQALFRDPNRHNGQLRLAGRGNRGCTGRGPHHVPFLGVRAVSDGHGDPLGLPGFPFQFFVYRQLAGNNAATVTMAFLHLWVAKGQPTAH